jgi:choline dehydrogenase
MNETYDYIVIGGGSAGCVVAGRLSAAGASVVVLEAGGSDRRPDVYVPAGVVSAYKFCNWKFLPEPDLSREGLVEAWPAGKILGGGGSINGTVFVRGNRADFDGWAKLGCTGWDYDSVLAYFKRMESWSGDNDEYRGSDGPIGVGFHAMNHPSSDAFLAAAQEAGHEYVSDYNGGKQEGVGKVQVNQRRGIRSQSSREYLRQVARRDLLRVRKKAFVRRIIIEGRGATGVEYQLGREIRVAKARREVVLSAGSLVSPKILMLSGIGPHEELERHGIDVVADRPGVGANLRDHIGMLQRWHSKVPTLNELGVREAVASIWEYARYGSGALAATVFQVQVIHRTSADLVRPDIQLAFASFAIVRDRGADGMMKVKPAKFRSVMVTTALLHPRQAGRIRLRSPNPSDSPIIQHQMLANDDDVKDVLAGTAEARRIMQQPAMSEIIGEPFEPERQCRTDADWLAFLHQNATHGVHPVGTCRMGVDSLAVVDPELRVEGISNLRVVDASIMPTTISGNTNAATMMIAEKAADLLVTAS